MIEFPGNILKAESIQLRLYTSLDPLWILAAGTTPYIRHTETPRLTWVAESTLGQVLRFKLEIWWVSITGVVTAEIDTGFSIYNQFYNIAVYERLSHIMARDAGGYYRLKLTAQENGANDTSIGGVFKVNYTPTRPTNLTIA